MKNRISIHDFEFGHDGCGNYWATYTSPKTGRFWTTKIDEIRIVDVRDNPTQQSLIRLMNYCKRKGTVNTLHLYLEY